MGKLPIKRTQLEQSHSYRKAFAKIYMGKIMRVPYRAMGNLAEKGVIWNSNKDGIYPVMV